MQQIEYQGRLHGVRNELRRGRITKVATSGGVGEREVMLNHRLNDHHVIGRQTDPRTDARNEFDPDIGVISGITLADVVEQSTEHQQVGTRHTMCEVACVSRRLPQVPVDGEAVIRVALRTAAIGSPLREDLHPQPALVERFEYRNRVVASEQQADEIVDGTGWPRCGHGRTRLGQTIESRAVDARALASRRRRDTKQQRRVGCRVDIVGQMNLTLSQDNTWRKETIGFVFRAGCRHSRPDLVTHP